MSLERFKAIDGFEDYEVSTWGRIFNTKTGRYIRPEICKKGYLRVDLYNDAGRKHCKVHRLVAKAFIPNPENKPDINHIDGNNQNNSISNLEWVTNKENSLKATEIRRLRKEEIGL